MLLRSPKSEGYEFWGHMNMDHFRGSEGPQGFFFFYFFRLRHIENPADDPASDATGGSAEAVAGVGGAAEWLGQARGLGRLVSGCKYNCQVVMATHCAESLITHKGCGEDVAIKRLGKGDEDDHFGLDFAEHEKRRVAAESHDDYMKRMAQLSG